MLDNKKWADKKISTLKNQLVITLGCFFTLGLFLNFSTTDASFDPMIWKDKFVVSSVKLDQSGHFSHPLISKNFFKPRLCEYRLVIEDYFGENVSRLNFKNDYSEDQLHELSFTAPSNINEIDSNIWKKDGASIVSVLNYDDSSIQINYLAKNYKRTLAPSEKMKFIFQEKCPENRAPASL